MAVAGSLTMQKCSTVLPFLFEEPQNRKWGIADESKVEEVEVCSLQSGGRKHGDGNGCERYVIRAKVVEEEVPVRESRNWLELAQAGV